MRQMETADFGSVDGGGVCVVASVASTGSLTLACVSVWSRDCGKQWQSICVGGSAKQTDGSISGIRRATGRERR